MSGVIVYGDFLAYDLLSGIFLAEAYLTAFCYASWALGKSPGGYDPYEATALMFCVLTCLESRIYCLRTPYGIPLPVTCWSFRVFHQLRISRIGKVKVQVACRNVTDWLHSIVCISYVVWLQMHCDGI